MSWFATSLLVATFALIGERIFGYPNRLFKLIKHPVVWMGAVIDWFDKRTNLEERGNEKRRRSGALCMFVLIALVLLTTLPISLFLRFLPFGFLIEAILASSMLAQRSLEEFVGSVAEGLERGIDQGREAVRHIVGRDPASLSESDVAKAAIESLAENTSDGVVAPLFWMALFGLPGAAVYKAINTADSMIGHKSDRYLAFGWTAARVDDLANYLPARGSGFLFAATALTRKEWNYSASLAAMMRDSKHHVSPNAGWPESALAGALNFQLGGKRSYNGKMVDLATMGDGEAPQGSEDIHRSLKFYWAAMSAMMVTSILLAAIVNLN